MTSSSRPGWVCVHGREGLSSAPCHTCACAAIDSDSLRNRCSASSGIRTYDAPAPSVASPAVTCRTPLPQAGLPAARSTPESRDCAQQGAVRSDDAIVPRGIVSSGDSVGAVARARTGAGTQPATAPTVRLVSPPHASRLSRPARRTAPAA